MSEQQQPHTLTLRASLSKTIEKLTQHKILSKSPLHAEAAFCIHPQFELPTRTPPSASALHSTILNTDIRRLRRDCEKKFWASRDNTVTKGSCNEDVSPSIDIDRIRIMDNTMNEKNGYHPNGNSSDMGSDTMTPFQFKQNYLHRNIPCIIQNISLPITNEWYNDSTNESISVSAQTQQQQDDHEGIASINSHKKATINTQWFLENVGEDTIVPVRINQEGYEDGRATECLTLKMTMKQWIHHQRNDPDPKHYLKDWHMQSLFQDLYKNPVIFYDVLNPFLIENEGGDYRFVYWGCKGSKTGIHSDVLNSFSWSYNVVGKKRWTFYHPDDLSGSTKGAMVVIQDKGEMMYVPSGWRHSVENLEETISVNHNWMMAGALDCVFACLVDEIGAIEGELSAWGMASDDMADLSRVREDMLRGCVGMDVTTFCVLVLGCFVDCLVTLVSDDLVHTDDNEAEQWFDFICIRKVLGVVLENTNEDNEGKATNMIALRLRLISTLGHNLGCEVMDVMHALYEIRIDCTGF